jgi:Xaa-Pro aminopeptidase
MLLRKITAMIVRHSIYLKYTLISFDFHLIDQQRPSADEVNWINAYHPQVRDALSPLLTGSDLQWLSQATHAI